MNFDRLETLPGFDRLKQMPPRLPGGTLTDTETSQIGAFSDTDEITGPQIAAEDLPSADLYDD